MNYFHLSSCVTAHNVAFNSLEVVVYEACASLPGRRHDVNKADGKPPFMEPGEELISSTAAMDLVNFLLILEFRRKFKMFLEDWLWVES